MTAPDPRTWDEAAGQPGIAVTLSTGPRRFRVKQDIRDHVADLMRLMSALPEDEDCGHPAPGTGTMSHGQAVEALARVPDVAGLRAMLIYVHGFCPAAFEDALAEQLRQQGAACGAVAPHSGVTCARDAGHDGMHAFAHRPAIVWEDAPSIASDEAAAVPAGAGTPTLEEGTSGRVSPVALAVRDMTIVRLDDDEEDVPGAKVWTRKLSTGVRTYRWVPAEALDAYLAEVGADPDRELIPDPHAAAQDDAPQMPVSFLPLNRPTLAGGA